MKKVLIILTAVLGAVMLFFICAGITGMGKDTALVTNTDSPGEIVGESAATAASKAAPKTSVRPQTIREGMWEVGTDIKPGKYKTKGALEGIITLCTWSVMKGDNYVDVGSVNETTAQGVVTLKAGQTFETNGCQTWYAAK